MNRIQHPLEEQTNLLPPTRMAGERAFERAFESQGEIDSCHCLSTPLHYERNYAYPLVVWLHGADDDERQVTRVMPLVSSRNYVAVGPRATVPAALPCAGFSWSQDAEEIERAEGRVMAAIAAARRWLNVAPDRIFLAGYADGGTMALRIALAQPRRFAGVLSFCGALPDTRRPLAQVYAARRLKLFIASGRAGRRYPESEVCRNLRLFHAAGLSVSLRLYPCGDELTTNMLSDMDRWIMEQVAPQPALEDQPSGRSRGK